MKTVDYLVVGQGIAGTMVSHFLLKEGKSIFVVDAPNPNIPSLAAGAVINPVTGRKTVKSWKIDELLPAAKTAYRELEQILGISIITEIPIHKYFSHPADRDAFDAEKLLMMDGHASILNHFDPNIKHEFGAIEIHSSCRIDVRGLHTAWRNYLISKEALLEEDFDYQQLEIKPGSVTYKGITANKIIFCEGSGLKNNPWFNYLPLSAAKGEAVIIEMPGLSQKHIILKGFFLLPIGNDQFYVGSTNQWETASPVPTEAKRAELEVGISKITNLPYTVLQQMAGLRPNVRNRRPLIGIHPKYPSLAVFNGMGTKGFSLSPWCAAMFVKYLERNEQLDPETNISRLAS